MRSAIPLKIRNKLREIRVKKKMTQSQVAFKCGLALSTYQNIEKGKSQPSLKTALLIAKALDYQVEKLFRVEIYQHD
ncbi:MAG: helix-turn-helix domain-containing protein [Candidatus Dojkabacteria bacterium]|nr:helix-turn-helix domain-containing protein [Candidatus Dojkabacteria bacterium]